MKFIRKLFPVALTCVLSGTALARPVTLTCSSSADLYAAPYTVVINSKDLSVQIMRPSGSSSRRSYGITQVNNASDGGYVVTASGRLQTQIKVMVSSDEKWIEYLDVITDRTFSTDYCS